MLIESRKECDIGSVERVSGIDKRTLGKSELFGGKMGVGGSDSASNCTPDRALGDSRSGKPNVFVWLVEWTCLFTDEMCFIHKHPSNQRSPQIVLEPLVHLFASKHLRAHDDEPNSVRGCNLLKKINVFDSCTVFRERERVETYLEGSSFLLLDGSSLLVSFICNIHKLTCCSARALVGTIISPIPDSPRALESKSAERRTTVFPCPVATARKTSLPLRMAMAC